MKHPLILRLIFFIFVLIWCTGFSINVLSNSTGLSIALTPLLNFFYDNICHQDGNKLISSGGNTFLVCARCSGLYFGALAASAFLLFYYKKINISFKFFTGASIVLLIDVLLNNFFFNAYNKTSAFATGIFLGSVSLLIIINQLQIYFIYGYKD